MLPVRQNVHSFGGSLNYYSEAPVTVRMLEKPCFKARCDLQNLKAQILAIVKQLYSYVNAVNNHSMPCHLKGVNRYVLPESFQSINQSIFLMLPRQQTATSRTAKRRNS